MTSLSGQLTESYRTTMLDVSPSCFLPPVGAEERYFPLPFPDRSRFGEIGPSPLSEWKNVVQDETSRRTRSLLNIDPKTHQTLSSVNERLAKASHEIKNKIALLTAHLDRCVRMRQAPGMAQKIMMLRARIAQCQQQLKSPINFQNFQATTLKLDEILNDPQAEPEKKAAIERIRQQLGLTAGEMRLLFTDRIKHSYTHSNNRLVQSAQSLFRRAQQETQSAIAFYGPNSPQAFYAQANQVALAQGVSMNLGNVRAITEVAGNLYPKPKKRGFWSKVKSGFKKAGSVLKTAGNFYMKALSWTRKVAIQVGAAMTGVSSWSQLALTQFSEIMKLFKKT